MPAWWLIRRTGRSIVGVVNPAQWRRWLTWGGGIGLLIALSGLIPHALQGKALFPSARSFALVNVLLISPVRSEERRVGKECRL